MNYIFSKIFWVFLAPGNFLTLLLVIGAFLSVAHNERRRKAGRAICFITALLIFLVGILPVGSWMLTPLENKFPPERPEHVTGIILLGGDERPHSSDIPGRPIFMDSGRRYIEFAALAKQYPDAKLVFSGGSPMFPTSTSEKESDVVKQILPALGIPVEKVTFEDVSRNTHENAVKSYKLLKPTQDQTWLLVTSAYHMPRSLLTFRKAGWNILPATTGYLTDGTFSTQLQFNLGEHLMLMSWAEHEYYGLLAYKLMGYTDAVWPDSP